MQKNNLLSGASSAPGRVRTFVEHPEYNTTPHSCALFCYNNDPVELIKFVTIALKGGAGVKVIFPAHTNFDLGEITPADIWYRIDPEHVDAAKIDVGDTFNVDYHDPDYASHVVNLCPLDTISGTNGILHVLDEIYFYCDELIVVDLSNLRPAATINKWGMQSSGPSSFWDIFKSFHEFCQQPSIGSLLTCLGHVNHTMRRGGYKKGIVTSAMEYDCPLISEYLDVDITGLLGSHKLGLIIDPNVMLPRELIFKLVDKRNEQSLFLEKVTPTRKTWYNVCMGLEIGHRGTCLIWRVNLGMCRTFNEIVQAFVETIYRLVKLHLEWRDSKSNPGIYADLEDDCQVGLDVMGLANYLSIQGITYLEFVEGLELYPKNYEWHREGKVYKFIDAIVKGYESAIDTADKMMNDRGYPPLERMFTVEPAQSHSYETLDIAGYTTCRGIFAPFGRLTNRTSDSEINRVYNHGKVETASEIGADLQLRLCNAWQILMNNTGRAHAISQDTYAPMTVGSFMDWVDSPSRTLYYAEHNNYNQRRHLAKSIAVCTIDDEGGCSSCAE